MPSGERRPTLAGRLSTTLAVAALSSAAIATIAAMLLADTIIATRVQSSVAAAARVMQVEIDESPTTLEHVESEARTLGIDGRVEVVDVASAEAPPGGCTVSASATMPELQCAQALGRRPGSMVVVAVPAERLHGHRRAMLLSALAVLLLVAAVARTVGGALSRRSLVPLDRLRRAVADADAASPAAIELPEPTGLEEIDALRNAMESLLRRLHEELGRARRFAASAAHELRTPLATMRAQLELAVESPPELAERTETMARLLRTTTRLEALTERLLLLATPYDAMLDDRGASMAQLVEGLVDRRFGEHAARLQLSVCEDDALVLGDEHLLASMLDNLVDNALKYSDGPVRVSLVVQDDAVVLDVQDQGAGISEQDEAELFRPFRRGPGDRPRLGHGLGLPLARHIARASGGQVELLRGAAVGTTVRIRLPRHRSVHGQDSRSTSLPAPR